MGLSIGHMCLPWSRWTTLQFSTPKVDAKFLTMRLHIVAHDLIYGLISPDLESVVYKKDIF